MKTKLKLAEFIAGYFDAANRAFPSKYTVRARDSKLADRTGVAFSLDRIMTEISRSEHFVYP